MIIRVPSKTAYQQNYQSTRHPSYVNERQVALLGMYKDVATVLNANDIRFYLVYGSAIGALRHKGFIP